ncbi:MAG: PmoA family protein [Verrucomicrobiia bacterium]
MNGNIYNYSRRDFVKNLSVVGLCFCASKFAIAQSTTPGFNTIKSVPLPPPTSDSKGLTFNAAGYDIWIRKENELIAAYRAHPTQKYPYIYPLIGPKSGISLTTESALPWYHHRSIFFGCDRVNGDDYWSQELDKGKIVSSGPKVVELSKQNLQIFDRCLWRSPKNEVVMSDERKINFIFPSESFYFLDWEITLNAEVDVTIQKTNHSLFALRAAPDITPAEGGSLQNSQGDSGEKNTFGKTSPWCAFYGKRKHSDCVEGIALLDHPKNPWAPTRWFTRDYGFISPTPLNFIEKPLSIRKGDSLKFKYRLIAFSGTPQDANLKSIYTDWAKT